jgi:hypothetical protein
MKTISAIFLLLTLAACSGASTNWVKPGATEDQLRADQLSCRNTAERATARNENVTRDIRTTIPGGRDDTRALVQSTRDLKAARNFERLFAQCMRGLGYTHPKS